MSIQDFLKEKTAYILCHTFVCVLSVSMLVALNPAGGKAFSALICCIYLIGALMPLTAEFIKKRNFYNELLLRFENIDRKNLIAEVLSRPEFYEGALFYDILKRSNKACLEEINNYKNIQEEYREYIELWVHEIKTPISSSKLIAQNNRSEPLNSVLDELDEIEGYVEQVLYYAKSNAVEKDYIIKEISLEKPVFSALKRNSSMLIRSGISVSAENLNNKVYSDIKWLEFILHQLIINAIKYAKDSAAWIRITSQEEENSCILQVSDNGIGIEQSELPRVFEKGFTGTNGRLRGKSTGMGLYICQKLSDKLGISIIAESTFEKGTTITLVFPKNSMTNIVRLTKM
ncbi:signal transduction histidine kinase [Desulfosporosinus orientis DSM 765]|uniref:histidine kinase n=1 Tax=Desulfosporosinus orientis (strain ATCC 19365 / DSM 765 / NCIMB 8382 / VKM B-1628 / Singapore I) TaxID=768706 RepID=G7WAW9_DESOD|nr:sensor histidine kinase [Desulfosporosinus orientis]AET67180.1 signal transduction histidine kinase [Desulfosporosinus orientis DSM 765]